MSPTHSKMHGAYYNPHHNEGFDGEIDFLSNLAQLSTIFSVEKMELEMRLVVMLEDNYLKVRRPYLRCQRVFYQNLYHFPSIHCTVQG